MAQPYNDDPNHIGFYMFHLESRADCLKRSVWEFKQKLEKAQANGDLKLIGKLQTEIEGVADIATGVCLSLGGLSKGLMDLQTTKDGV